MSMRQEKIKMVKAQTDNEEAYQNRISQLVFLPHSEIWAIIVIININLHVQLSLFSISFFEEKWEIYLNYGHYFFEIVFLIDVTLRILHRNVSSHKDDLCVKKMPFVLYVINILTLIPIYEVYVYLLDRSANFIFILIYKGKALLRLFHVFHYFYVKRREAGVSQIIVIFYRHLFFLNTSTMIISAIWGSFGCYKCNYINWMDSLEDYDFNTETTLDKFLYSSMYIASILLGNYGGTIKAENKNEAAVILLTILISYFLQVMILMAQLTAQYVAKRTKKSIFSQRMENIKAYLNDQFLGKQLVEDINSYYNTFWQTRRAIPKMPRCFELLPVTLQKEVATDIFWDSLKHSHLFRDLDMTFRSELSLIMKSEFLLAGDILYTTNTWKYTFVYIVSGIVQILSEEDDESPVLSFSGGTVLSEINCLLNIRSTSTLRCSTLCEFQTLSMPDLFRKLLRFRHRTKSFQLILRQRLDLARVVNKRKYEDAHQMSHGERTIRRLKNNWRKVQQGKKIVSKSHTLKYLDLLVLSDAMELKVEVVCLTSKFPIILDPNSSFRKFCDMICLGAAFAQFLFVPYLAAFQRHISYPMRTFFLILDLIYLFDISLQATTAIKTKNRIIASFLIILSKRVKQFPFLLDVVAIIPLDYFFLSSNERTSLLLKLPRVLKIYKVVQLIVFDEKKLGQTIILIMYVKYIVLFTIMIYLLVCLFYMVSCFDEQCIPFSWYIYNEELSSWKYITKNLSPIVRTLIPITALTFGCGSGDIHAYNILDNCIMLAATLIGYYLLAFCLAEITSVEYWLLQQEAKHKIVVALIIKLTRIHKMSNKIVDRIKRILIFRWEHTKDMIKCDAFDIFHDAPNNTKKRLRYELIQKYLKCTTFFQNMNSSTVKRVAKVSKIMAFPPKEYITHANRDINYIFFIKRGYCMASSTVPGDKERKIQSTLKYPGDCFPVVEVMHKIESFLTVQALSSVECIVIPYEILVPILKMDICFYEDLQTALSLHMRDNSSILQRKEGKLNVRAANRTKEFGDAFTYELPTLRKEINQENISGRLKNLFIYTFSPFSKFFITWEVLRCILATIEVITIVFYLNILHNNRDLIDLIMLLLDITVYVDIFIKSRLTYFKNNGILVRHFLMTFQNYYNAGFYMDFFSAAPLISTFKIMNIIVDNLSIQIFILFATRVLQVIRIFYGLTYLCNRYKILSEINLLRLKCFLYLLIAVTATATIMYTSACKISKSGLFCSENVWANTALLKDSIKFENMLGIFLYFSSECLNRSYCAILPNSFELKNVLYLSYFILMFIFMVIIWFLSSKLVSSGLHSEYTSQVQNDRRNFKEFSRKEALDDNLLSLTLSTNEYLAKDVEANAFEMADSTFTPQIREDVWYTFNKFALRSSLLLAEAPESFIRYIAVKMKTQFFKKDGIIVRLNDVHNYLYIVKKGKVEVTMADTNLTYLIPGGMFGCFNNKGYLRQTVTFRAVEHTQVLMMNSTTFYCCCSKVPAIKNKLDRFVRTNPEYAEANKTEDEMISRSQMVSDNNVSVPIVALNSFCEKYYSFVNKIFNQNNLAFIIFNYLLTVHLSAISVLYVLFYQLVAMYRDVTEMTCILYVIDVVFMLRIFFGLSLRYVDIESGVTIKDKRKIVKRYFKTDFAVDFITLLWPEFYFSRIFKGFTLSLFTSNRLLRFIFLWRYYNQQKKYNKLTHYLRWTFLLYVIMIYLQLWTNIWNFFACYSYKTCLIASDLSHKPLVLVNSNDTLYSALMAYNYMIGLYSSTILRMVHPQRVSEMRITFIAISISIFMFAYTWSGFSIIEVIDTFSLERYNYDVTEFKTYLQHQKLSPAIFVKATDYLFYLWKVHNGEQLPELLKTSNNYLKQDIMNDVYGHHLLNHRLFKNTHVDFLRQVMMHFKRIMFPSGYVIIEKGDVDNCMYFIHSGIVEITLRNGFKIQRLGLLTKNESFGEYQGILEKPHEYTYIAKSFVTLIILNKDDWGYLLDFFPASVEKIMSLL